MALHAPVLVLKDSLKRESGAKVQHGNIHAAKAVSDIIRTTLGPRSMLKMLLDASGGIVVTNDGNAILRELDIAHPAAKSMIELSRTQDEEVGDGTTSVIVLAGEMLHVAETFIEKNYHPTVICRAYSRALEDAIAVLDKIAMPVNVNDREAMLGLVKSSIGTKFTGQFGDLIADLAIDATTTAGVDLGQGMREVDIKKYIKVEKIPGGQLEDSKVLKGVMFNKDVVAPGKMRRKIVNPRIILLDCPVEYKKGENQTNAELMSEEDWKVLLDMEEEYIKNLCVQILKFKPDLVITEKGLSDMAMHYLSKAGVSAIRRLRKTDNNRIAKACGAVIVNRPEELQESDVGTRAGLFEVKKIGDEFFSFIIECKDPKACTVLLRGASKDILNEVERNLQDAMSVARNILKNPKLLPGGGASELTVSGWLSDHGFGSAGFGGSGGCAGFGGSSPVGSGGSSGFGGSSTSGLGGRGSGGSSGFGGRSPVGSGGSSGFGGSSVLGGSSTSGFGGISPVRSGGSSGFGGSSVLGSSSGSGFGGSSVLGSSSCSGFGGSSPVGRGGRTGFGGISPVGSGGRSVFGGSSTLGTGGSTGFGSTSGLGTSGTVGGSSGLGNGGSTSGLGCSSGVGSCGSSGLGSTSGVGKGGSSGLGCSSGVGSSGSPGFGSTSGAGRGGSTSGLGRGAGRSGGTGGYSASSRCRAASPMWLR